MFFFFKVDVEECDPSAQVACEKYRGFIEISYKQMVKVPLKKGKARASRAGPLRRFTIEMQKVLLCQLLITLPKKAIEADENADNMSYHFDPRGRFVCETLSTPVCHGIWAQQLLVLL